MELKGFQKLTLLDYPGKVACTVFTGGCNFLCPFCQNSSLVLHKAEVESIDEEDVLSYLYKRRGILDGICITGGEPLLQSGLSEFIAACKHTGMLVKLDTNGYLPEKLDELIGTGSIDYIAMDIKSSPKGYSLAAGLENLDFARILRSIELIRNCGIAHEFRTTVVNELHSAEDFDAIGKLLSGEERYFLQKFVDSGELITAGLHAASDEKMNEYLSIVRKYVPNAELRGM